MQLNPPKSARIIITAVTDKQGGIAKNGAMPHREMTEHFYKLNQVTAYHPVIMGWNTAQEILQHNEAEGYAMGKWLGERNIVLSTDPGKEPLNGTEKFSSLAQAIQKYEYAYDKIYLIGGASVFAEALTSKIVHEIWLAECYHSFNCDTFFPHSNQNWTTIIKGYPKSGYRMIHKTIK